MCTQPFDDPDPFQELTFPSIIAAKRAIANYLGRPLARLTAEQLEYIDNLLTKTLKKPEVMDQIRDYFKNPRGRTPC